MNIIPGADVVGFGFNILGEYDTSSLTTQLFIHQTNQASDYTYAGITYAVPDNLAVVPNTNEYGTTEVFQTAEQFQSYFSAKAGVSGSYGAFKGQFDAAYANTFNSNTSYWYCLSEASFNCWDIVLESTGLQWLSPGFSQDPSVDTLPSVFNEENKEDFFQVFRKFGTHYVTQVVCGGNLNYYEAVETSYSSNEQEISANAQMEYKALFLSASAQSSAEWNQLGESWANSRVVTIACTGGDASILNVLNPGFGDDYSNLYSTWSTSVNTNPAVMQFTLRPLSTLFSGDTADAVQQALVAYTNGAIIAQANANMTLGTGPNNSNFTTNATMICNGNIISPDPVTQPPTTPSGYPIGGLQVALLDSDTQEVQMCKLYYQDNNDFNNQPLIYTDMLADIQQYGQGNYICVVTAFAVNLMNYPTADFANWLYSCGAALSGWKEYIGFTGSPGMVSYTCIGKKGLMPGQADEDFSCTIDWYDDPWVVGDIDASSEVLLYDPMSMIAKQKEAQLQDKG